MKQFLTFLTKLKSFWKFYRDYGYDGETATFIVENYQDVLQSRTKLMSYPTYYAKDVIEQIDKWYEEHKRIDICETYDYQTRQIEFSVDFRNIETKEEFINAVIDAIEKKAAQGEFLK